MEPGAVFLAVFLSLFTGYSIFETFSYDPPVIEKTPLKFSGSPLRLHLIGDFGELETKHEIAPDTWQVDYVASSMDRLAKERPISMIIAAGDNVYEEPVGIDDPTMFKLLNDVFALENLDVPWYAVLGNHDCYTNSDYEVKMTNFFEKWNMPDYYYSKKFPIGEGKNAGFAFLNGCELACVYYLDEVKYPKLHHECSKMNPLASNSSISQQYSWLEGVLKDWDSDSSVVWRTVVIHMPIFSVSKAHGDNDGLKQQLYPLLFKYNVDFVLSGHDHHMQYLSSPKGFEPNRFEPRNPNTDSCGHCNIIKDGRIVQVNKGYELSQIVMGASGGDLDDLCFNRTTSMANVKFGRYDYGFAEINIDPRYYEVNLVDSNSTDFIFTLRVINQ